MAYLEILARYQDLLGEKGVLFVIAPVLAGVLLALYWRAISRIGASARGRVALALVFVAAACGLGLALSRASMFDDAYISFRYARNLVEGNGLVYNLGDRVEGYTNFLWTVGIAAVMWLSPWDAPEIALVGCLLCFLGNLALCYRLSITQRSSSPALLLFPPVAVLLLAVQGVFVDYATTGLETGWSCLLVQAGTLALMRATSPRGVFISSLFFILATLTRPDHAIFYGVGSLVVAAVWGRAVWTGARTRFADAFETGGRHLLAWASPFLLYVAVAGFKYSYYGQLVPNTYYAKSANLSYFEQGAIFAESFYLGTHFWLVGLLFLVGLFLPVKGSAQSRFRWFAGLSFIFYNVYVMKVGGDFMYGRFFVSIIPLILIGAEFTVARAFVASDSARSSRWKVASALLGGVLLSTAGGVRMIEPKSTKWYLADESSFYQLKQLFPVVVEHSNFRTGNDLGKLHAGGHSPLVATSGVGMLGYNSRLPILDIVGLVDSTVAHQTLARRRRPGHEKVAKEAYVRQRNPHFIRAAHYLPRAYRRLSAIRFGSARGGGDWFIYHYDRKLMNELPKLLPDARFRPFEKHLDGYIKKAQQKRPRRFEKDYEFFQNYYFHHNEDQLRQQKMEQLWTKYTRPAAD